jgi:hypothetical protein
MHDQSEVVAARALHTEHLPIKPFATVLLKAVCSEIPYGSRHEVFIMQSWFQMDANLDAASHASAIV